MDLRLRAIIFDDRLWLRRVKIMALIVVYTIQCFQLRVLFSGDLRAYDYQNVDGRERERERDRDI